MPPAIVFVIALALMYDLLNGIHNSSNIVATMISSRAFRPFMALGVAAVAEFLGPFLFGVAVARTIGDAIIQSDKISLEMLMACLGGAIFWNLLTWFLGLPSSSSHGLIGGMIGAAVMGAGLDAIKLAGLEKALIALFTSPLIGFGIGFAITRIVFFLVQGASPHINEFFKRSQLLTAMALALSHGANDGQKTMGVIALTLVISGYLPAFAVPAWVVTVSAAAIALGTALGGWRLIRTLGGRFYKIRPVDSFASQLTSALVILGASIVGWPVSTTQVVSSAIIGVGSSDRLGKVRWGVAGEILTAWIITIPAVALVSAGIYWLIVSLAK